MKKRLLSALLALCMVLALLPSVTFAANGHHPFTDVSDAAWYSSAVQYVYEHGMMTGANSNGTEFSPNIPTSRGMIVTILHRLEETPSVSGTAFADVPDGQWYTDAVAWASANDIVRGYGNGYFGPNDPISREQMATILYRYAEYKGYDMSDIVSLSDFTDADAVSDWAETAMKWAVGEGLITGTTNTTISPAGTATRSQTATILMRFCTRIEALQSFHEKDIEDFEGYTVINYDNSDETNFAVLTDEAVVIESNQNANQVVNIDDENGVYVFKNANENLTGLQTGDIFYYVYGQGINEFILIKVGAVEISGSTVTLTAGESEMHDFFEYIDIDMDIDVAQYADTPNSISHNLETPYSVQLVARSASVEEPYSAQPLSSFKDKFKISVDKEFSNGNKLSLALEDTVTITIKMKYDFELWGKDYFEIKVTIKEDLDAQISYTAQATGKTDTYRGVIASLLVPIGSSGFWVDGDLYYVVDVDASADIALKSSLSYTVGFQYDTEKGYRKISECESDDDIDAEGKISLTFGIGTDIGVDFMKLAKASIEGTAGLEIAGKTVDTGISKARSVNHLCLICVDGDISFFVEAAFKVKFGVTEKWSITPVNASVKWNYPLIDFYISFMNGDTDIDFGRGDCPHKQYLVTVHVRDSNGQPVSAAKMEIVGSDELIVDAGNVSADGIFETYCDSGSYIVYVYGMDGYGNAQKEFSISGKAVQIDLSISGSTQSSAEIVASGTCGENLTWTLNSDGLLTISGTGPMEDYEYGIAPWSENRDSIKMAVIENGVTSIGNCTFTDCHSLTSATIPNSVTSIGICAFYLCESLTSVTIPDSVTTIGNQAFNECKGLTDVTIPDSVTSIGDLAFSDCESLTSVTIGNGVSSIGANAFAFCYSLTSVTIGNSVTSIGDGAFYWCDSLTSVVIPNSVTSIGGGAFTDCGSLTSVTIPNSVTSIGDGAFQGCESLTSIEVASGNPAYISVDGVLFNADQTILYTYPAAKRGSSYRIPVSVTTIGEVAFYGCESLTSVTISNNVTSIGEWAFAYCSSLASVTIPTTVTSIGLGAFTECESLKDVYYGGSAEQWKQISIFDYYYDTSRNATIHFNS